MIACDKHNDVVVIYEERQTAWTCPLCEKEEKFKELEEKFDELEKESTELQIKMNAINFKLGASPR